MKSKILFIGMALAATLQLNAETFSGSCGENASWEFNGYTLYISGSGAITDFNDPNSIYATYPEWDSYKEDIRRVEIGEGITSIGDFSFYKYFNLESVSLPEGLTRIGNYTFAYCNSLKGVTLPSTLEALGEKQLNYNSNGFTFYECKALETITIPESLKVMGGGTFNNCSSLREVRWNATECDACPDDAVNSYIGNFYATNVSDVYFGPDVKVLSDRLFFDVSSLFNIHTQGSIEYVGADAFKGTAWVASQDRDKVIYIDKAAVMYIMGLEIPEKFTVIFKEGTMGIADLIFDGNEYLQKVEIPESVTRIGQSAFRGCTNLSSVNWNPVDIDVLNPTPYNGQLFSSALEEVIFGANVKSIHSYLFYDCKNLQNLTLPESLEYIGSYAFQNCESITELSIPDNVVEIGDYAISFCSDLQKLSVGKNLKTVGFGFLSICNNLSVLEWNAVNTEGYVYNGAVNLESIVFGDDVESVPAGIATSDSQYNKLEKLSSVVFGSSVRSIGEKAFESCSALEKVELPESLETIGDYAFRYTGIRHFVIPAHLESIGFSALQTTDREYVVLLPLEECKNVSNFIDTSDHRYQVYAADIEVYLDFNPLSSFREFIAPLATADVDSFASDAEKPDVAFTCNIPDYSMQVTHMPELDMTPGDHTVFVEANFTGEQFFSASFAYRYSVTGEAGTISAAADEQAFVDIYTVDGILLKKNFERRHLNLLPSGIYIVDSNGLKSKIRV